MIRVIRPVEVDDHIWRGFGMRKAMRKGAIVCATVGETLHPTDAGAGHSSGSSVIVVVIFWRDAALFRVPVVGAIDM